MSDEELRRCWNDAMNSPEQRAEREEEAEAYLDSQSKLEEEAVRQLEQKFLVLSCESCGRVMERPFNVITRNAGDEDEEIEPICLDCLYCDDVG